MQSMLDLNPAASADVVSGPWKVGNLNKGEVRSDLSKQWMARPHDERFLNLGDMLASTRARYDASHEHVIDNRAIEFHAPEVRSIEDTHRLRVHVDDGRAPELMAPTNWSFGQLAGLVNAPAGYLRTLPSPIVADNLNWGIRRNRDVGEVKVYYSSQGGDDATAELMAATGPTYGRIPDWEVVRAVMQIAGQGTGDRNWKVPGVLDWRTGTYDPNAPITMDTTTLYASDRDVFIFLVDDLRPIEVGKLPDGSPDYVFRGFYVTNSEVGKSSLQIACFYLRGICCNRLMWGVEGFETLRIVHSSKAPERFIEEARPALQAFSQGSVAKLQQGVEQAKAAKVAKDDDAALQWLQARDFSKSRAKQVLEAVEKEEGHKARTVWDMAQGITAVARDLPHQDTRVDLERRAGKILDKVA